PNLFETIGDILKIDFRIVAGTWESVQFQAADRRIDGLLVSEEAQAEEAKLERTRSYQTVFPMAVVRSDSGIVIESMEDLAGLRVAYPMGINPIETALGNVGGPFEPHAVGSSLAGLELLRSGGVDAAIILSFDSYQISKNALSNLSVAHNFFEYSAELATGIRSDWPELVSLINKAFDVIGTQAVLGEINQWLYTPHPWQEIGLSREEILWLKEHPEVSIGVDPIWAPLEYINDRGEYAGVASDYVHRLEELLDIRFRIVSDIPWEEALHATEQGELDLMACVSKTPERLEYMVFTEPYIRLPVAIFVREDFRNIRNIDELEGVTTGLVGGYAIEEWLERDHPEVPVERFPSIEAGLRSLMFGDIDAYVGNVVTIGWVLEGSGFKTIKVSGSTPYFYELSIGIRSDWAVFQSIANKALAAITPHERRQIHENWVSPVSQVTVVDNALVWQIFIPLFLILGMFIFWNRRMSAEVSRRRQAEDRLIDSNAELTAANTELKDAVSTIETMQQRIIQNEKTVGMGRIVAGVAHEINTPIGVAVTAASYLSEELNLTKYYLERDHGESKELTGLVESSLNLTSLINASLDQTNSLINTFRRLRQDDQVPFLDAFPLAAHIRDVVATTPAGEQDSDVVVDVTAPEDPIVRLNPKIIDQIIRELVSNSITHGHPREGLLRISIALERRNGNIVIDYRDNGQGVESQVRQALFDPFVTTLRNDGHMGLGLTIVYNLAHSWLNGEIAFAGETSGESHFIIRFPESSPRAD
ncbi:MAG: transporter substrate-binding domain-containing protein, partial [Desulfobacterales bacterium]|nr:transporter substrate-binding domain-containing protein [Desulfobacterales bacterium]